MGEGLVYWSPKSGERPHQVPLRTSLLKKFWKVDPVPALEVLSGLEEVSSPPAPLVSLKHNLLGV